MTDTKKPINDHDANRDPITGEPGAHPVGTGVGAAGAGAAGAAIGAVVGGPVGAIIGAVVGAVGGGLAGKSAAESINPTVEDEYWRTNHATQPYVEPGRQYEDYQPAYRTGYEAYGRHAENKKTFDEVEPELKSEYEKSHSTTGLAWDKAKPATRAAWDRADSTFKLYEERLIADKQREKTGEVAVGKRVETETAKVSVPIEKERVVIERTTPTDAGTAVAPGDVNFGEGEVARVEVYEETADVRKEAFVREEVNVRKEVDRSTINAEEQLRREELDVKTDGNPVVRPPNQRPGQSV